MSTASSSTSSERDERVFIAAFGMMDSHQDGEAVAAFMRVRAILQRHGGGFRRMLNRSHEAERLNDELGKQNAQLLRENTALRARDSRPAAAASSAGARGPLVLPAIETLGHPPYRHYSYLCGLRSSWRHRLAHAHDRHSDLRSLRKRLQPDS